MEYQPSAPKGPARPAISPGKQAAQREVELRRRMAAIDAQIEEIDQELSTLPPVSDPDHPAAELLLTRRNGLEQERATLARSLTAGATEYKQFDSRWGATRYGTSPECTNIQAAGCGPTSLAIALNYLYQEDPEGLAAQGQFEIVTPPQTAAYAATHGRICNNGTSGDTMVSHVQTAFPGFRGRRVDLGAVAGIIRGGNLVIFLCHSCTGTNRGGGSKSYGGHFMVLNGVNDRGTTFNVLDPGAGESTDIETLSRAEL